MKVQKILKRLLQLHPKSVDLSLKRIKRLLKDLENPEKKISNVIQVVGTNGKHSICSTLREIFETANYSVNMNISPSIRKFNERYYLSGKHISDSKLHDLLIEVENINNKKSITFHEFICACFFLAASRNKSDVNILEAGLFFRLDASNVLDNNIASVVMPIGITTDAIFFFNTLLASSLKKRPDSKIFRSLSFLEAARKKHAQINS